MQQCFAIHYASAISLSSTPVSAFVSWVYYDNDTWPVPTQSDLIGIYLSTVTSLDASVEEVDLLKEEEHQDKILIIGLESSVVSHRAVAEDCWRRHPPKDVPTSIK